MTVISKWFGSPSAPQSAQLNTQPQPSAGQTIRVSDEQLRRGLSLQVSPGDTIEVSLHQGPSALNGYKWISNGVGLGKPDRRYTPDDRSPHALDPGVTTTFTFTVPPNASKRVALRFDESRPWEAGQRPISSLSLNLIVSPR